MFNFTLGDLIDGLSSLDQDLVLEKGFHKAHSYRGYYDQLAFEPKDNVTVGDMLSCAVEAQDKDFEGYKGGTFWMDGDTPVNLSYYGETGRMITGLTLSLHDDVVTLQTEQQDRY